MSIFLFKENGGVFCLILFFLTDFTKEFSDCVLFDFDLTFCYSVIFWRLLLKHFFQISTAQLQKCLHKIRKEKEKE